MKSTSKNVSAAVVVFGFKLEPGGVLSDILKQRLDAAIQRYKKGGFQAIIVCGYHPMDRPDMDIFCEADLMEAYIHAIDPTIPVLKERTSRSIPENWLFLRRDFPGLRQICLAMNNSVLERVHLFATAVYGEAKADRIEYLRLPGLEGREQVEQYLRGEADCMLQGHTPGNYRRLLNDDDTSKFPQLVAAHAASCRYAGMMHP